MSADEFDKLFLCDFTISEDERALYDRLMQYYDESKECSNQLAFSYWKNFKHWCDCRCITTKEINQAKKNVAHLIKD